MNVLLERLKLLSELSVRNLVLLVLLLLTGCRQGTESSTTQQQTQDGPFVVLPGMNIQEALDLAAIAPNNKKVIVQAGVYNPERPGFAFLMLEAKHEGVQLIADGEVVLSASSPDNGTTAIVSHILYCGDGLTNNTVINGLTLTGANGYVSKLRQPKVTASERSGKLQRGLFYFLDGGALKVFGKSSPTFQNVTFKENETQLCGGAVSIEQQGFNSSPVTFKNCQFISNRCPATGSAVDVLSGSSVQIDNCLFVGNVANYGMDQVALEFGLTYNEKHGSGALTVFPESRVTVRRSTFTKNWNAIDDHGSGNTYENCLLWQNNASDGSRSGEPYEFDILDGVNVKNCFTSGVNSDLRGTIDQSQNVLDSPAPDFDDSYVPRHPELSHVGYRPVTSD